jgi:integrase
MAQPSPDRVDIYSSSQKICGGRVGLFRIRSNRHLLATHLLEDGYDIGTIQESLGHKDVKTASIPMYSAMVDVMSEAG